MAFTFDPSLPADVDWVRLLIGDTSEDDHALEDESIEAMIAENVAKNGSGMWTKYLVAALAGRAAAALWNMSEGGVVEKQVGDLRVKFGGEGTGSSEAMDRYLDNLQERGAELLLLSGRRPSVFKVL